MAAAGLFALVRWCSARPTSARVTEGEKRPAENDSEAIPFTKKFKNAPFGLLKRTDKPFLEKIAKAREEDEKKEAEEKKIEAEQKKEDAANKVLEIIKCFS